MFSRRIVSTGLRYLIPFLTLTYPAITNAQTIDVEGTANIPYDSKRIDADSEQKLITLAEIDAISRYAANFSASKTILYKNIEENVKSNINQYVSQPIIIDSGYKKDQDLYYIVIKTSINDSKLEGDLSGPSTVASEQTPRRKTSISFLFVSRSTSAVRQFDDRVTKVNMGSQGQDDKQSEGLSGGRATISSSNSTASETVSGGSTVKQADQLTYIVSSPEDMNASMSQVFTDAGFEVYDYADITSQCGGVTPASAYQAFSNSDNLPREMRKSAFDAARKCGVNTFATGTLDVGLQDTDPVTGNIRVFVSVRTQVNDLSTPLPRLLASVGPVQYSGLGPNAEVARRNALINAAKDAAMEISDQLKSKGLN